MIWRLIESGMNTGKFNMDFDIQLASECREETACFRLYRWNPYTISLGANQSFDDIDLEKAEADNIGVVKRPTGGRAILHAEEITYSVVFPYSHKISPKEIYEKISTALVRGLEIYHPMLKDSSLESQQPNFPQLLQDASGVLCFGSTAKNEVKFNGRKIIGSAQRKLNNVILQHGSILCGKFHRRLVDYLNTDEETKSKLSNELAEKTIEIETILNEQVDYEKLSKSLIEGFEETWSISFEQAEMDSFINK